MKVLNILLLTLLLQMDVFGQIPNGGFEDWETIENYEKPIFWDTNQDSSFVRFEKDTMAIEGEYALKIVPSSFTAWQECISFSTISIKLQSAIGDNKSLTFFAKSVPDTTNQFDQVYLRVRGELFVDGEYETDYQWETFERIDEFTKIQIPILNSNVDSLTIQILGGAVNTATDGCSNRSVSWIDGMGITETDIINSNKTWSLDKAETSLYPNPSNGWIAIRDTDNQFTHYTLFSLDGKLLESGKCSNSLLQLNTDHSGMFLIRLMNGDQSVTANEFIYLY